MSATVLDEILAQTREDVERRKRELPLLELQNRESKDEVAVLREGRSLPAGIDRVRRDFRKALSAPGIAVIAEFKRRSPSAGTLRDKPDLEKIVGAYERGGAAALSILTESPHFEGSLEDLRRARAACGLPILCKDFIVDPYQVHEAQMAGADAVLLIVSALELNMLGVLHSCAQALGIEPLVEVHDRQELDIALSIGAQLIGINNRDLRDFSVDLERTSRLLADVPAGVTVVSESGIASAEQLRRLQGEGVQAVLVGESLMRAPDPEAALRALGGL